jgi:hypothetical protein
VKISPTMVSLAVVALITAGCGGSTGSNGGGNTSSAGPSSTAAPQFTDQQKPPARLVIDVTIKGGEVTPTNAQVKSGVGEPIIVKVNSDAADQLHVHSNPEHMFNIEPKKEDQSFQFTVTVPGQVDVELHQLNKVVATITVQ